MQYHERERKNKENAHFVYIVFLLTKLCNIFDEAFLNPQYSITINVGDVNNYILDVRIGTFSVMSG